MSNQDQSDLNQEPSVKHDIFEDPAIARSLKEDPILRFIVKWWRQVLVSVLAVVAVFYIRDRFSETYAARLGESGDLFTRVSAEYSQFEAALKTRDEAALKKEQAGDKNEEAVKKLADAEGKVKESRQKLTEALNSLADAQEPYDTVAGIYRGLLAIREGNVSEARGALGDPVLVESDRSKPYPRDAFYAELKALILARAMLNDEKTAAEGRRVLKDVAQKARYVNVSAAMTLGRTAQDDSQRKEAVSLMEAIIAAQPEQAQVLAEELGRLKA